MEANGKVDMIGIELSSDRIADIAEKSKLSFDEVKFLSNLAITEEELLMIVQIVMQSGMGAKEYIRSIMG